MKRIYLEDIDLNLLNPINDADHSESTLFHDNKTIYKIYDDLDEIKRERKQRKIELLGDGKPLPITIMPKTEIFCSIPIERFEGLGMDYITKSKTLYKKFTKSENIALIFRILDIISRAIMEIHLDPRKIVISDLHVQNIIIDRNYNPFIVDIDSCKIDGIKNDTIPTALKKIFIT